MKKLFVKYKLIIIYVAVLLIGAVSAIAFLSIRSNSADNATLKYESINTQLLAMTDSVKTKESYSKLPEDKRQDFLNEQAAVYALDSRLQQATPDTLRGVCVERSNDNVIAQASRMRAELGAEDFREYTALLAHAQSTGRANCYANFDPAGAEDVPEMMAHP